MLRASMQGEITVRVRYGETDCMGRVYHANYLPYFECGRVELMREMGFNYAHVEKNDECFLPVIEATVKYRAPAFFDDEIRVRTRVVDFSAVRLSFAYEVHRLETGILCAEGRTVLAAVDRAGDPRRLPDDLRQFLESLDLPTERVRRKRARSGECSGE